MTGTLHRELHGSDTSDAATLTLLTWNVLADGLAFDNFIHAPEECLRWTSRRERILAELESGLDRLPDVICLQEVDHHDELASVLDARGYAGAFSPKAEGRDGCSLFADRERFALEDVETLRYRGPEADRVHTQLALLATLTPAGGGTPLRVATTHLKAREGFDAIRELQATQLAAAVTAFDGPVVVAGDFNDVPGSPAHTVMRGALSSAYATLLGDEPSWTTWKVRAAGEKKRTIDYVWHSPALRPVACLAIPADAAVEEGRLPSWQYPSDHLSLVVRFALS